MDTVDAKSKKSIEFGGRNAKTARYQQALQALQHSNCDHAESTHNRQRIINVRAR
ncbi:hypothetical protein E4U41_002760 [Claviceps citrina]|nr:hypothetical protein E4U41_002760 [Claviceps citrina]